MPPLRARPLLVRPLHRVGSIDRRGQTLQDHITNEEFPFDVRIAQAIRELLFGFTLFHSAGEVLLAKPAMMPALAKMGKILGPRQAVHPHFSGPCVDMHSWHLLCALSDSAAHARQTLSKL